MKYIIYTVLLLIATNTFAQDQLQNLKKYWHYRERLKKFIVVSPNYNEEGTNIPAAVISQDKNTISWDDGNGAFNQYLSVLATEYRLLKNFNQDYTQTIKELYYALKSFERLDKIAESKYRSGVQYDSDLNGFFLRDDVGQNFWNKYKKNGTNGYFDQTHIDEGAHMPNSLDNCIHFLESFSLIEALVDNEIVDGIEVNFKQLAKDNTRRIVQNMQQDDEIPVIDFPILENIHKYSWYLKNPVTGEKIPNEYGGGLDGTMLYASYGFTKAANRILGEKAFSEMKFSYEISKLLLKYPITDMDLKFGAYWRTTLLPLPLLQYVDAELTANSSNWKETIFDLVKYPEYYSVFGVKIPCYLTNASASKTWHFGFDDYKSRSLCATGDIDIVSNLSPYEVLIRKQRENAVYKYEHFPLLWSVITNNTAYVKNEDRTEIFSLLNEAPTCGPYKFLNNNNLEFGNTNWSSTSRLIWPEDNGKTSNNYGYYNGLDYMLLHNLYWLCHNKYPYNVDFKQFFPLPKTVIATNNILCSSEIKLIYGSINLVAGNKIELNPGFEFEAGDITRFTVRAYDKVADNDFPYFFQRTSLQDYPNCGNNLKSATIKTDYFENTYNTELSINPNPSNGKFVIELDNSEGNIKSIEIFNMLGVKVYTISNVLEYNEVDLSDAPKGIYIVKINEVNSSSTHRVVIE